MAAPTAPRKNFITRDHRYVYLGGSFIALLGLGMFYSAPSPYSFIPAQSVFGTALAAICWRFSWSFSAFRSPTNATTTL